MNVLKKTDYNAKITEIKIGLATTSALTAVENKIPDTSNLQVSKLQVISKLKIQIITQKLVKLKGKLLIMIMINILLLQSLII